MIKNPCVKCKTRDGMRWKETKYCTSCYVSKLEKELAELKKSKCWNTAFKELHKEENQDYCNGRT